MRGNPDFMLRNVADTIVLVPVGKAAAEFSGMITLNATSAFLWQLLETEQSVESMVAAMTERYEVTEAKANEDIIAFVQTMESAGAILR